MNISPRFTIKCLNELGIELPKLGRDEKNNIYGLFSSIEHPLISHTKNILCNLPEPSLERISCIDDNYFIKCKPNAPVRGAVIIDSPNNNYIWWIVSGGKREEGSKKDFYKKLEASCIAQLKIERQNDSSINPGKKTFSKHLLPTNLDYKRANQESKFIEDIKKESDIIRVFQLSKKNLGLTQTLNLKKDELDEAKFSYHYRNNLNDLVEFITVFDPEKVQYVTDVKITFGQNPDKITFMLINNSIKPEYFELIGPPEGELPSYLTRHYKFYSS